MILGVSTQQYGRYERGQDRISAAQFRLAQQTFLPRTMEHGGFSEEQLGFISDVDGRSPTSVQSLNFEWEQLRRNVERFLLSLSPSGRARR
jgi:transcriptional regulator with XRE-family HTH domain